MRAARGLSVEPPWGRLPVGRPWAARGASVRCLSLGCPRTSHWGGKFSTRTRTHTQTKELHNVRSHSMMYIFRTCTGRSD